MKKLITFLMAVLSPFILIGSTSVVNAAEVETVTSKAPFVVGMTSHAMPSLSWYRSGFLFNINDSIVVKEYISVDVSYKSCDYWLFGWCTATSNQSVQLSKDDVVNTGSPVNGYDQISVTNNTQILLDYETSFKTKNGGVSPFNFVQVDKKDVFLNKALDYDYYLMTDHIAIYELVMIKFNYINLVDEPVQEVCTGLNCDFGNSVPTPTTSPNDGLFAKFGSLFENAQMLIMIGALILVFIALRYAAGPVFTILKWFAMLFPLLVKALSFIFYVSWEVIKIPFKLIGAITGLNKDKNQRYYTKQFTSRRR